MPSTLPSGTANETPSTATTWRVCAEHAAGDLEDLADVADLDGGLGGHALASSLRGFGVSRQR